MEVLPEVKRKGIIGKGEKDMLQAKMFDHTLLKADATKAQVEKICQEAVAYKFASVCIRSLWQRSFPAVEL